jgi:hypothetical protein
MPLWPDIEHGWRASRRSLATALATANVLTIGFVGRVLAATPSQPPFTGDEVYVKPEDDYIRAGVALGIIGLGLLVIFRPGSRRFIAALAGIGIIAVGFLVALTAFVDLSGYHKVNVVWLAAGIAMTIVGVAVVAAAIFRRAKPRDEETDPGVTAA